jgi:hypothetical protein
VRAREVESEYDQQLEDERREKKREADDQGRIKRAVEK